MPIIIAIFMKVTAAQIAHLIGGTVEGNPDANVSRPARIEAATEGEFAFLDNPRYESYVYSTEASIVLVSAAFQAAHPIKATLIRVEDVRTALALLLHEFDDANQAAAATNISARASVHPTAKIGLGVSIGDFTVIEEGAIIGNNTTIYPQVFIGRNVRIGENSRLYPGVRVHFDCTIGDQCIIHANAVIGADGFGFAPQEDKTWKKVPQVGNVIIENQVEIGACTCIDRAALGSTTIRAGAKLDNLIHVAHNVEVGQNTALAAQVGIAGSTRLGQNCQIGGQAGFAGHITIADGTRIQAQSGLASSIEQPGTALFGSPAIGYKDFIRSHIVFKQLPELQRQVTALEKKIALLQSPDLI